MTVVPFPAGMTTITVTGTLSSLGKSRAGSVRVYAERKFGYIGTDWIMDEVSAPVRLVSGRFAVTIPHSDQFGLIGDNGAPISNVGYKLVFQPDQSATAEVLAWTPLLTTTGTPIPGQPGNTTSAFSKLGNLGGWPNAVIVIGGGPVDPNPTAGPTLVQVSPGVFRKV